MSDCNAVVDPIIGGANGQTITKLRLNQIPFHCAMHAPGDCADLPFPHVISNIHHIPHNDNNQHIDYPAGSHCQRPFTFGWA